MPRRLASPFENMFPELTNLLPISRVRAFRRAYFMRLAVVAIFLASVAVAVHGLLLAPSYFFAARETAREQQQLDAISASLATTEEKQVSARLSALRDNVAYLSHLGTAPTASSALRAVLAVPRSGITLGGLSFTPSTGAKSQMMLTGMAATRDALRQYDQALATLPFVASADLPISAYAKDTNIPFTITLTGALQP